MLKERKRPPHLLSSWPRRHNGQRSSSGPDASEQPAARSNRCYWNPDLHSNETLPQCSPCFHKRSRKSARIHTVRKWKGFVFHFFWSLDLLVELWIRNEENHNPWLRYTSEDGRVCEILPSAAVSPAFCPPCPWTWTSQTPFFPAAQQCTARTRPAWGGTSHPKRTTEGALVQLRPGKRSWNRSDSTTWTFGRPSWGYESYLQDFGVNRLLLFVEEANHLNSEVRRETTNFRLQWTSKHYKKGPDK